MTLFNGPGDTADEEGANGDEEDGGGGEVCVEFTDGTFVLGEDVQVSTVNPSLSKWALGWVLSDRHGIDGVEISDNVFRFSDDTVDRGMKTMVILRGKSEDRDTPVRLCQFIIPNQPPRRKLVALSPESVQPLKPPGKSGKPDTREQYRRWEVGVMIP